MDTYNNKITLIAGSGKFAFKAALFLHQKNFLKDIILISDNYQIKTKFKKIYNFKINNIENLIKFLLKDKNPHVLIVGYVEIPPINEIKFSITSRIFFSKNLFLNNLNNQSKLLKEFIESKKIKLISQKKIFNGLLINKSDMKIKNNHNKIYNTLIKNSAFIKKIFSLNISQSLIFNGDRVISMEDIFGTNVMIKRISNISHKFSNLIFIKSIKKDQIEEIDFPIIGNDTLNLLIKYNFKAICLINKNVIIAEKNIFLDNIYKSNLSLIVI